MSFSPVRILTAEVEAVDEDFAVADLAGARRSDDRFDHLVDDVRVDRDFDFQLGKEAHGVFRPAIDFGMPLLPPIALDLRNRQTVHSDGGERIAHLLEFERLYDRHYDFHKPRPILTRRGRSWTDRFRAVKSERERAPPESGLTRRVPCPDTRSNSLKRNCYSAPEAENPTIVAGSD